MDEQEEYGWSQLPETLLQDIFELLPLKNLGRCSQVCYNWATAFYTDRPWRKFQFKDNIFVRQKFTQHSGWQYHIDHWRLKYLITNAARKWRELEIVPVTNLFNLYDFIQVLTRFTEYYERNADDEPLAAIRSFRFEWKMHIAGDSLTEFRKVIGTGGEMLNSLLSLLVHLLGCKSLSFVNMQLDAWDCDTFMEKVYTVFAEQLEHLIIVNVSRFRKPLMHVGLFLSLRKLVISPQNIDDDTLMLIGDLKHLDSLVLLQNDKTSEERPCSEGAWRQFRVDNRQLTRVHLIIGGKCKAPLLLQPGAPVYAIVFENSCGHLTYDLGQQICCMYSNTIVQFIQKGLERYKRSNIFKERADIPAVEVTHRCHRLKLFALRERISNSTALILAKRASECDMKLCLRRNGMLKRNCWRPTDLAFAGVSLEQKWLRQICKSYDRTMEEIRKITNDESTVMTDKRYKYSFV